MTVLLIQTILGTGDVKCSESSFSPNAASPASQQEEYKIRNIRVLNWIKAFLSWQTCSSHTMRDRSAFLIKHLMNELGHSNRLSQ